MNFSLILPQQIGVKAHGVIADEYVSHASSFFYLGNQYLIISSGE